MRFAWLIVTLAALMANGQESKPPAHKGDSNAERKSTTDTAGQTVVVVNQQTPQEQDQPKHSYHELLSPPNIANSALALIGIVGIATAIVTLLYIRHQAIEMRRQRVAMTGQRIEMKRQRSVMQGQLDQMQGAGKQTDKLIEQAEKQAKALLDAVDLQEANFQQWVDVVDWTAQLSGDHKFGVGFNLLNSSDWPLKILTTHVRIGHTDSLRRHEISITPKQSCSVSNIEMLITDDWYNQYLVRGATLPVYVKITYLNCLRKTDAQEFTGLIICSPTEIRFQLIDLPNIRAGLNA
jgi:hypothetical protein